MAWGWEKRSLSSKVRRDLKGPYIESRREERRKSEHAQGISN